jgi:hypothetical protein
MREERPARSPDHKVVAAALFAVAFFGFLAGKNYVGSIDTLPAELQPIALLKTGRLDFTALFPPGTPLPYSLIGLKGRIVSIYPIAAGLLNVPVFTASHLVGYDIEVHRLGLSLISAAGIAALSAAFLYLALVSICRRHATAVLFTLGYSFGTEVFSVVCRGLWQHGPSLLFINASLALLLSGRSRLVALSGLTLGLAVAARPTDLLLALPLAVWVVRHERSAWWPFAGWAALPAAATMAYSAAFLDSPFKLGKYHGAGLFFSHPSFDALAGLFLSPSRGLFVFDPVFLFAFALLFRPPADPRVRSFLAHAALFVPLLVVLVSFWHNWWGGHSFGYRIMCDVIPVFVLALAVVWEEHLDGRPAVRGLFMALALLSTGVHLLGAFVPSGFETTPNNIDEHPERLWDVTRSQIPLALRNLHERAVHHVRQP